MKKLLTPLLLVSSMFLASCGDSPEALADDTVDVFAEITEILKEFGESGDSQAAVEKLKGLEGEVNDLSQRMKDLLKDEFDNDKEAFGKKMNEVMEGKEDADKIMEEFMGQSMKLMLSGEEGAKEVAKVLNEIGKDLK